MVLQGSYLLLLRIASREYAKLHMYIDVNLGLYHVRGYWGDFEFHLLLMDCRSNVSVNRCPGNTGHVITAGIVL